MSGKNQLYLLCALTLTLYTDATSFFHFNSFKVMEPAHRINESDFGFSLSYQKDRLVVGAPHSDLDGQIYGCPINDVINGKSDCQQLTIQLEKLARVKDVRSYLNPNQHLCLGMSIVSTSDYIMTCAPLWPAIHGKRVDSFGTCFVYYNETDVQRYSGLFEQGPDKTMHVLGTMGLSMLYDDQKDLILFSNPSRNGEISFVSAAMPTSDTQGLFPIKSSEDSGKYKDMSPLNDMSNIGYSMAAGKFFSNVDDVLYAFSLQNAKREEKVAFLKYYETENMMGLLTVERKALLAVKADDFIDISADLEYTMLFGAAMSSADINADNVTELLIGAPGYSDEYNIEVGALFILVGGSSDSILSKRHLTIFGDKNGGRFGTTIASNDLDGDHIPEIFVSAPFEGDGIGVLYILSGYEVNMKLINSDVRARSLGEFSLKQVIESEKFYFFGYSLQVVPDLNENGCDELAVGSPKSAKVVLLRCIPAITVTLFSDPGVVNITDTDTSFAVKLCLNVTYPEKSPKTINTKIILTSEVISEDYLEIKNKKILIDLSLNKDTYCTYIQAEMKSKDTGHYVIETRATTDLDTEIYNEFDSSWVSLSPYSVTSVKTEVFRDCIENCEPRLSTEVFFNYYGLKTSNYTLGPKATEELWVELKNSGGSVSGSCVVISVKGARVLQSDCELKNGDYMCYVPGRFTRDTSVSFPLTLDMTSLSRTVENINVVTHTYASCLSSNVTMDSYELQLNLSGEQVEILTTPYTLSISEDSAKSQDQSFKDIHEYIIVNNGFIIWDNVTATVSVDNNTILNNTEIATTPDTNCSKTTHENTYEFSCAVSLMPKQDVKIVVTSDINKQTLAAGKLEIVTILKITLDPSLEIKYAKHTSSIIYEGERGLANNRTSIVVIAFVVAFIILVVLCMTLYKVGFFKRKQKARLENFKQNVRKQSIKQPEGGEGDKDVRPISTIRSNEGDDIEIEVVDENLFDTVDISTSTFDNPAFIPEDATTQAEIGSTQS